MGRWDVLLQIVWIPPRVRRHGGGKMDIGRLGWEWGKYKVLEVWLNTLTSFYVL